MQTIKITDYPLSSAELAERVGKTLQRINQLSNELASCGYALKLGRDWRYKSSAVEFFDKVKK